MRIKAKEGLRVQVHSADKKEDLGKGTIEEVNALNIEGWIIPDYPSRIVLDSGKVTEGCDCWWFPLGEQKNMEVRERRGDIEKK